MKDALENTQGGFGNQRAFFEETGGFIGYQLFNLEGSYTLTAGNVVHNLSLTAYNLTDELYAEFSNATFFRPQPGRSVTGSYRLRF